MKDNLRNKSISRAVKAYKDSLKFTNFIIMNIDLM